MKTLTLLELAQAIEDGKTIERRTKFSAAMWVESDARVALLALIDGTHNVRIKPEPREYWICAKKNYVFDSKEEAAFEIAHGKSYESGDIIHVREVVK